MQRIECVLADSDGTLVDSRDSIFSAFEYSLNHHGYSLVSREMFAKNMGKPLEACYQLYTNTPDVRALCQTHREFQQSNMHLNAAFPGVLNVITRLRAKEVSVAVVTNRSSATSLESLKAAGLLHLIDTLVTTDDVKNPKPDAEPLLLAMDRLHATSENSLMIGDTDVDVLAGKNAGVRTVGVTYGFHGEKIADSDPTWTISMIEELLAIVLLS